MNDYSAIEPGFVDGTACGGHVARVFVDADDLQIAPAGQLICQSPPTAAEHKAVSFRNPRPFENQLCSFGISFRQSVTRVRISVCLSLDDFCVLFYAASETVYPAFVRTDVKAAVDDAQAECFAVDGGVPDDFSRRGLDRGDFVISTDKKSFAGHNHRVRVFASDRPAIAIFHFAR